MILILLLTVVLNVAATADLNYTVPSLKHEVTSTWSLSVFSQIVRESVVSAVPFPWETVEQILESGENVDIDELGYKLINHELPLLVPACLGFMLSALVPIIMVLICCCRCCGRNVAVQNLKKKKPYHVITNAFILVIMVGFLSVMAMCIPISADRLKTSPRMIFRTMNASLGDIQIYLDEFRKVAPDLAIGVLQTAVNDTKADLDELPYTLSELLIDGARPVVDKIENKIHAISDDIDFLKETEIELNDTVEDMILHSNNLVSGLNTISGLFSSIKADCIADGKSFCAALPDGLGDDATNINIDNTKMTGIANEVTKLVDLARQVDIAEYKTLRNSTFEEVPITVKSESQGSIDSVKARLDTVQGDLEPEIDKALEAADFDMDFSYFLKPLDEKIKVFEDNYHIFVGIFKLLGGVLFITAMLALVGLLLGLACTNKPETFVQRGRTKAGHCGSFLLLTSVGLAVLPLLLILFFGSLLMLLGGNFTIFCDPLQDLTVFKRLIDSGLVFHGESLGEKFFNDSSINMSVTYLFRTCQRNGTIYSGLNLDSILNLTSLLNADEFVPDLDDSLVDQINDTVKDISIIDASRFDDLIFKRELPDMDTNATKEIDDELNGFDLEGKARDINDLADSISSQSPSYAARYRTVGTGLQQLHSDTKVPLKQSLDNLTAMIDKLLNTSLEIKRTMTDLETDLSDLTNYVETQAVGIIVQALQAFLDRMKLTSDNLINTTLHALRTDIGQCKILAEIYDTVVASLCVYFLDPLNLLWASFYTGGIVCFILMISSFTISKYFRRFGDSRKQARRNSTVNANPSGITTDVVLTHYSSFGDDDRNNNATIRPKQNYKRLHNKWTKRRRFITGPFSAQFFGVDNLEQKQTETEETVLMETVQGISNQRYHSGGNMDSALSDSACFTQSLSSVESKSQDTVSVIDENQNCINCCEDTTEEMNGHIFKREEIDFEIVRSKASTDQKQKSETVCHISNEHQQQVCTGQDHRKETCSFPYFQLAGDEFILIPVTNLQTESYECNDAFNQMKANYTAYQRHVTDTNYCSVDNDRWLRGYKIESNGESVPSSPLVKYSTDDEDEKSQMQFDMTHLSNSANDTTFSNLGDIESDDESVTCYINDTQADGNSEISQQSNEGPNKLTERNGCSSYGMDGDRQDQFPVYKIVCSLCRKHVNKDVTSRKDEVKNELIGSSGYSNELNAYKGDVDDEQKLVNDDCLVVRESIRNSDIGKISKSLEDNLHTFDEQFQNMSKGNEDSFEEQADQPEQFDRNIDENKSQGKLDIKVKPYKPLKRMKTPRSAFMFWKCVEANCSSPAGAVSTWPRENHACEERNFEDHEVAAVDYSKIQVSNPISVSIKSPANDVEILPENEKKEQHTHSSCNEPEALQTLAVAAGRLAYLRESSINRHENEVERPESRDDRQPQSLASISTAASSCLSNRLQKQEPRCEIATTIKNNTPVSYV